MFTKFVLAFTLLALVASIAGTIPVKGPTCTVILSVPATVAGTPLKAGEYRVAVNVDKATFTTGKESFEIATKVETVTKFEQNVVQYENTGNQTSISQISLGGTKVRLIFN